MSGALRYDFNMPSANRGQGVCPDFSTLREFSFRFLFYLSLYARTWFYIVFNSVIKISTKMFSQRVN